MTNGERLLQDKELLVNMMYEADMEDRLNICTMDLNDMDKPVGCKQGYENLNRDCKKCISDWLDQEEA